MPFQLKLSAKSMAVIALLLWFMSLMPTGIVLYGKERHIPGYEILATGWLSPLMLNFAWFANLFFLHAALRLRTGATPTVSAVAAAALSFDTFRLDALLLNEGGSTSPVYGYGWGAVLWFISIFIVLMATGTRQIETGAVSKTLGEVSRLRAVGFGLLVGTILTSSAFALYGRIAANPSEAARLKYVAVKRGKVCTSPDPSLRGGGIRLTGPLQLMLWKGSISPPLGQISSLLSWGVPVVRFSGYDYSLESAAVNPIAIAVPAHGPPAATLYVRNLENRSVSAALVLESNGGVIFDQHWERERKTSRYCPDYSSYPTENEQPRRLLVDALSIQGAPGQNRLEVGYRFPAFQTVPGTIVAERNGGSTEHIRHETWSARRPDPTIGSPRFDRFTINCAEGIGWNLQHNPDRQDIGWPFTVKGVKYFLGYRNPYNATCDGDFVYFYSGFEEKGEYKLTIERRRLRDFQQMWAGVVVISGVSASTGNDMLKVQSVKDQADGVTIDLAHEKTGHVFVVSSPLRDK